MTTNQLKAYIATVITTALETEPTPFPESAAYLALGADLETWKLIRDVMIDSGMITCESNCVKLTTSGRALAKKVQNLMDAAKVKREAAEATHHPRDFEAYREECKARFAQPPGEVREAAELPPQRTRREDPTIRVMKETLSDDSVAMVLVIEQDGQKIVLDVHKDHAAHALDRIADAIEEETLHVVTREYY